jgi:2-iminobutanoate/2-iminopropanoate deaminase
MAGDRTSILTDNAPSPKGAYVHAIAMRGDLVFCSGQIGVDPATGLLAGSVGAQATQALRNLDEVCRATGARLADAARMTLYLADIADIAEVNAAYAEFFAGDPPARTTLQAAALVGGGRVCIDAIVVLP